MCGHGEVGKGPALARVDVPVIISDKFLLFMSYENLEVPQFQFIDRVVEIPVL